MRMLVGFLLVIVCLPVVFGEEVYFYDEGLSDVFLEKSGGVEDYYSFVQWDLGGYFESLSLDNSSVNATLRLKTVEGSYTGVLNVWLLPDQSVNLTGDSVASLFTEDRSNLSTFVIDHFNVGWTHDVDVTPQFRQWLNDRNNSVFTLRFEVAGHDVIIPNFKNESGVLRVGNDSVFHAFGSVDNGNVVYHPDLRVRYNLDDNVYVNPYASVVLPVLVSNVSLDLEGLTRTLLLCSWWIDGIGVEAEFMNGSVCPSSPVNFTFEDSEDYYVRIDFAVINYSWVDLNWSIVDAGLVDDLNVSFVVWYPEPPAGLYESIVDLVVGWFRSVLCWLGFSGFC